VINAVHTFKAFPFCHCQASGAVYPKFGALVPLDMHHGNNLNALLEKNKITNMKKLTALPFALFCLCTASGAVEPVSIETLTDPAGVGSAAVSPDGKHIAALIYTGALHEVMVADVDTLEFKPLIKTVEARTPGWYSVRRPIHVGWAGSAMLAVNYNDRTANSITLDGKMVADLGVRILGKIHAENPETVDVLSVVAREKGWLARINARTGARDVITFPYDWRIISFAGVSDLEKLLDDEPVNVFTMASHERARARIGDIRNHKQQLDQVSPLKQAERLKLPLLLVHGVADGRVPLSHTTELRNALKDLGRPPQVITLEGEGNGIGKREHIEKFYKTMLIFLNQYIGGGAK
jgi:pimeloyl-ACP methyl ester carboxylesterase